MPALTDSHQHYSMAATRYGPKQKKCTWKRRWDRLPEMEPTPRRQINLQNQVSANGAYGTKNSVNLREHVPLLSGCTLSVFSWVVNRWRWKKTFVQPPSAPQWIMDLILALIDRFGDRENELSWHLELSTFPKAQSRFTKEITGFQVAMALMYEQMLNMSRIIMCKGNAYQFSTDRP